MITSIEQLILQIHTGKPLRDSDSLKPTRTRWTTAEESLFEHLFARFGTDYPLLGSFLPRKTQKQLRKKCRQMLRYRVDRLHRLEQEIAEAKRKSYFDQMLQSDLSSSISEERSLHNDSCGSRSPPCDDLSQSLLWAAYAALYYWCRAGHESSWRMSSMRKLFFSVSFVGVGNASRRTSVLILNFQMLLKACTQIG